MTFVTLAQNLDTEVRARDGLPLETSQASFIVGHSVALTVFDKRAKMVR